MDGAAAGFEYDHDIIGVEFEVGQATITRDHITRYCAAVGETNPLYLDDEAAARGPYATVIAPPSMLSALLMEPRPDPDVRFGNASYAAGTRFEYYAPVHAGDTIRVTALVKDVYAKTGRSGTMVFAVYQSRYRNQHDVEVAFEEFARVFRQA